MTVEELLRSDSIDVVLNLTPPASHASVTRAALEAGKHVYSEKPLAIAATEAGELCALAESEGLRLACAPDIFLGSAYQKARSLLDDGAIGEPLAISAAMLAGGQEVWHPDPDIFYRDGAGPLLDMGPYYVTAIVSLLGPVRRVAGFASTFVEERTIKVGPRRGERFTAETPTHITSMLELQGAVTATLVATFEAPGHYASTMLVHGSDGELALPDPNGFAGPVRIRRGRGTWEGVPFTSRGAADARGLGSTTWSRRSRRGGRTGRRRSWPPTSSTWRARSSPRARADRPSRSRRRPSGRTRCRSWPPVAADEAA